MLSILAAFIGGFFVGAIVFLAVGFSIGYVKAVSMLTKLGSAALASAAARTTATKTPQVTSNLN